MSLSIVKQLRPSGSGWQRWADPSPGLVNGYDCERWYHRVNEVQVMSAVEVVLDDGISKGPEYHISISKIRWLAVKPGRCSSHDAKWVLAQFGLEGAEEDNHVPGGVVRNFWRTVAEPLIGLECACKADEPAIVEDKGDFVWRP